MRSRRLEESIFFFLYSSLLDLICYRIFDVKSGLKLQEVQVVKTPDGKEVRVPSTFSNYKEVKGVKFPFSMGQKMGPMDIKFEVTEIKINEGVTDEDFK